MLGVWLAKQEEIRAAVADKKTAALKLGGVRPARFPKAEAELEVRFKERRRGGRRVTGRWLVTTIVQLVKEMYPGSKFVASRGWLHRCCHRLGIAMRTKSNCKGKAAQDRLPAVLQWLARYRAMLSTPLSKSMTMDKVWGRFVPRLRFNCDQVCFYTRHCTFPFTFDFFSVYFTFSLFLQPRGCTRLLFFLQPRGCCLLYAFCNRAVAISLFFFFSASNYFCYTLLGDRCR